MLDQSLITATTAHAGKSLSDSNPLAKDFRLLDNFLSSVLIDKLQMYINTASESEWQPVPLQDTLPRRSINWQADTVIEELHIMANNLTPDVNQLFGARDLKLQAIQLWRDTEGYSLQPHKDNPVIDISLQIYLFDCPSKLGTSFLLDGKVLDVPFKHNTGYILFKESYDSRIKHWTTATVPKGVSRYSLYVTWSIYGKQAPNPEDIASLI